MNGMPFPQVHLWLAKVRVLTQRQGTRQGASCAEGVQDILYA